MKTWYQLYRPVIVSDQYPESFFRDLSPQDFQKLFIDSGIDLAIPLHLIAAEYHWIKTGKRTFFIPEWVSLPEATNETKLESPICLSFHKIYDCPPCLLYPTKLGLMVHNAVKGVGLVESEFLYQVLRAIELYARPGLPHNMKERNKRHFKGKGFHL